jgi:hypothetical protein
MNRQQLQCRNAALLDMVVDLVMHEPSEGAAQAIGYRRMTHCIAANVRLVENCPLPCCLRAALFAPGESRIDHPAFWHEGRAVTLIEG